MFGDEFDHIFDFVTRSFIFFVFIFVLFIFPFSLCVRLFNFNFKVFLAHLDKRGCIIFAYGKRKYGSES